MYPSHPGTPDPHAARLPRTGQARPPATRPLPGGALASFVTYAKALETLDRNTFPDEYAEHSDRIKELRPLLKAHGILDVMQIRNPEVAALIGG